ncbi:uncharacterized protein [Phyllobates terribilis]
MTHRFGVGSLVTLLSISCDSSLCQCGCFCANRIFSSYYVYSVDGPKVQLLPILEDDPYLFFLFFFSEFDLVLLLQDLEGIYLRSKYFVILVAKASGPWSSSNNRKALFDPVMAFMGQKEAEAPEDSESGGTTSQMKDEESKSETRAEENKAEMTDEENKAEPRDEENKTEIRDEENKAEMRDEENKAEMSDEVSKAEARDDESQAEMREGESKSEITEQSVTKEDLSPSLEENNDSGNPENSSIDVEQPHQQIPDMSVETPDSSNIDSIENSKELDSESISLQTRELNSNSGELEPIDSAKQVDQGRIVDGGSSVNSETIEVKVETDQEHQIENDSVVLEESHEIINTTDHTEEQNIEALHTVEGPNMLTVTPVDNENEASQTSSAVISESENNVETEFKLIGSGENKLSSLPSVTESVDAAAELEKLKRDMKMMETALQGAAKQAQSKADEIAKMMNENEHLKALVEDLRRKSSEAAEIESLREEYHQRVATLERKVYSLTRERDTLRREQNKKSDAAALLKEKDEIINQIMAEGEELSKKQATQEATIRKLRAQVRELEEEKKGLLAKLQVEENKVESIKKDKSATERLLQETIEKHQAELTTQKDYYVNALNAAKEAEALAEARVNNEARTELETRLSIASEREEMLVKALEELRQTLTRQEQQAAFKEDMLRRDMEDLQRRYQASERRCEELITQVPESTRPLLRQIEAMKETSDRRAEVWASVERTLNFRLQEAEAKAASAEERERSINERLSQTLSRINVLEAQISCLRAEQTQLTRSLEKERQRAAENRQEYLAAKEESDTNEGRVNQLEEELRELRKRHKQELQESLAHRELLEQELEHEKTARSELERTVRAQHSDHSPITKQNSITENGKLMHRLPTSSSISNSEESFFLQASLDSPDNLLERRNSGETNMSSYYLKTTNPGSFEAALRQKDGELSSYMSRLVTMESIRDSLAEELVQMTEQCEKLRIEAGALAGIRAELEALRRRHAAALELMGERDEELEELRADLIDVKAMYRDQIDLLINKIQVLSEQIGAA